MNKNQLHKFIDNLAIKKGWNQTENEKSKKILKNFDFSESIYINNTTPINVKCIISNQIFSILPVTLLTDSFSCCKLHSDRSRCIQRDSMYGKRMYDINNYEIYYYITDKMKLSIYDNDFEYKFGCIGYLRRAYYKIIEKEQNLYQKKKNYNIKNVNLDLIDLIVQLDKQNWRDFRTNIKFDLSKKYLVPSIDRINGTINNIAGPYSVDNIIITTSFYNYLKNTLSEKEFEEMCECINTGKIIEEKEYIVGKKNRSRELSKNRKMIRKDIPIKMDKWPLILFLEMKNLKKSNIEYLIKLTKGNRGTIKRALLKLIEKGAVKKNDKQVYIPNTSILPYKLIGKKLCAKSYVGFEYKISKKTTYGKMGLNGMVMGKEGLEYFPSVWEDTIAMSRSRKFNEYAYIVDIDGVRLDECIRMRDFREQNNSFTSEDTPDIPKKTVGKMVNEYIFIEKDDYNNDIKLKCSSCNLEQNIYNFYPRHSRSKDNLLKTTVDKYNEDFNSIQNQVKNICKNCCTNYTLESRIKKQKPNNNSEKLDKAAEFIYKRIQTNCNGNYAASLKPGQYCTHSKNKICLVDLNDIKNIIKKQNFKCAISNYPLIFNQTINFNMASPDRIDSSGHYSIDNLQIICYNLNLGKHVHDIDNEEIIKLINNCEHFVDKETIIKINKNHEKILAVTKI